MKTTRDCMNAIGKDNTILYELSDNEKKELQDCLFKMYLDIETVCKKHSITVMLGGGSALGAIRHSGFIPWDDDFDLLMPRGDYERFKQIFDKELSDKYFFYANGRGEGVTNSFGKIVKKGTKLVDIYNYKNEFSKGVCIDIFPLDCAPRNKFVRKLKGIVADVISVVGASVYMKKYDNEVIQSFMNTSDQSSKNYRFRLLLGKIFSFMDYPQWYKIYDSFVKKKNETGIWCIPTGRKHYCGEVFKKETFVPGRDATFNGRRVKVPQDVHSYLKNLYGDYMEVPPEDKRERHYFVEFDIGEHNK